MSILQTIRVWFNRGTNAQEAVRQLVRDEIKAAATRGRQ